LIGFPTLVEMQSPVFARVIEQWIAARFKPRAEHFANENHMIALN